MNLAYKLLLALVILIALAALSLLVAGRMGLLAGAVPTDLGVHEGRLKPPSLTPNSVSSQARLYPDHPRAQSAWIAPFEYSGDGAQALARLRKVVEQYPGTRIVSSNADYLRAEASTPWLRFTDDLEFWLDRDHHVIQVRSASRIGKGDLGANRKRVEALRAAFGR